MTHVSITQSDRYDVTYTDCEGVMDIFKRFDDQREAEAYALSLARRLGCGLAGRAALIPHSR